MSLSTKIQLKLISQNFGVKSYLKGSPAEESD
jgi:hypothetical protein